MVSNFSKSSQAGKEMLKDWACTCTFEALYFFSFHLVCNFDSGLDYGLDFGTIFGLKFWTDT